MVQVNDIKQLINFLETLPYESTFEGTDSGTVVVYCDNKKIEEYVCFKK
jgi:hypothetical protein